MFNFKIEYLLKWKNYPETANTWVSQTNMRCPDLLKKFEKDRVQIDNDLMTNNSPEKSEQVDNFTHSTKFTKLALFLIKYV